MKKSAAPAEQVRLQRFIAQSGIAARRKAEELILAGRVTVDGEVVKTLGTKVDPNTANVQVDGEPVAPQDHFYILFNKPKGCITAVTDDRGRLTVMDYLPNLPVNVAPVGRLDYYSEGVLLLTNDGELAARLLGPRSHVAKTYHVKIRGQLSPRDLERMRTGVTLDDGVVTLPAEVDKLQGGQSRHDWLVITLHEGKSRQIHRMIEALGYQVTKLQRVSFAGLTFHGLRVGDARELNQQELNDLRELVGLDRRAVARGAWSAQREDTDRSRREHAARLAASAPVAIPDDAPIPTPSEPDDEDETVFERQLEAARSGRPARHADDRGPGRADGPRSGPRRSGPRSDAPRREPTRADRPSGRSDRPSSRPSRGGARTDSPRTDGPRGERPTGRPTRGAARGDGPRGERPTGRPTRGAAGADRPRGDRRGDKPSSRPSRSGPRTDPRGTKPGGRPSRPGPSPGRPTQGGRKQGRGSKRGGAPAGRGRGNRR